MPFSGNELRLCLVFFQPNKELHSNKEGDSGEITVSAERARNE